MCYNLGMQLPIYARVARIYMLFIGVSYCVLVINPFVSIMLGFALVIPWHSLGGSDPNLYIPNMVLYFMAVILGILSLIALYMAEKNIEWIKIWYVLAAIAFFISFNELNSPKLNLMFVIPNFINTFLIFMATYSLHWALKQSKQVIS